MPLAKGWGVDKRLSHWILIPASQGSNPCTPTKQKSVEQKCSTLFLFGWASVHLLQNKEGAPQKMQSALFI
jgi:hypothetical protein